MKQKDFNQKLVKALSSRESFGTDLLNQIKDGPKLGAKRALEVYKEDYEARLSEALKNTYRAIAALIGDQDFSLLAKDYIQSHPSTSSDLDDYGHRLNLFLASHPLSNDYPFLMELAHFEWSFREIFHAKQKIGLNALDLMKTLQGTGELIQLTSSARVLEYQYQISSLYALKDSELEDGPFDFEIPQNILLYKIDSAVKTHTLSNAQCEIVKKMLLPTTLEACLQNAPTALTPEETQNLFQILGSERLIIKRD